MNMLHLSVEEDNNEQTQIDLGQDKKLTIGRGDDNDLVLKSKNVSMFHCKIVGIGQTWSLSDLDSTNGIKINGRRVQEQVLASGDVIDILPFKLKVEISLTGSDMEMEDATVIDIVTEQAWDDKTIMSTVAIPGGTINSNGSNDETPAEQANNFVVVKNGLSAGLAVPIHGQVTVGRGETCDIVLDDPFISREHLIITHQDGVCRFRNIAESNPVRLKGKESSEGVLKNGSVLQLGNSELKMRLESASIVSTFLNISPRTRIILLSCAFVFILGAFFINLGEEEEQQVTTEKDVSGKRESVESVKNLVADDVRGEASLEEKRQRSLFMYQARKFTKEGLLEKAANRLEASLEVVPDDQEAQELLSVLRVQISQKDQKQVKRIALVDSTRQQIEKDLLLVEESLQLKEFTYSLDLLEKIIKQQVEYPELDDLFLKVDAVFHDVKNARLASEELEKIQKKVLEKEVDLLREIYKKGWQAYKANNYSGAKEYWEKVSISKMDIPERKQARFYLSKLTGFLSDKTQSDYLKGLALYNKKDYSGALYYWNLVLKIDPNHPDIKAKMGQFLSQQIEKSRHLYQEGLVYEGINNVERAVKNWKMVLKELPLESSKYHQKAKAKLSEYGQK